MEFIIAESKLNQTIFSYLESILTVKEYYGIYFFIGNSSLLMRYDSDKELHSLLIYSGLIEEISDFFSIGRHETETIIVKWVNNKINVDVTEINKSPYPLYSPLLSIIL